MHAAAPPVGGAFGLWAGLQRGSGGTRPLVSPAPSGPAPSCARTLELGTRWRLRRSPAGSAAQVRPDPAQPLPAAGSACPPAPAASPCPSLTGRVLHVSPCRG